MRTMFYRQSVPTVSGLHLNIDREMEEGEMVAMGVIATIVVTKDLLVSIIQYSMYFC